MLEKTFYRHLLAIFFFTSFLTGACYAQNEKSGSEDRKTLIVTGASGELGGAAAKLLASDYNLILTGRDIDKLKNLQNELKKNHSDGDFSICPLDYTSLSSREDFKNYLSKKEESINGLVLITPRPLFHGKAIIQEESVWLEVIQTVFTGPLEALNATLPRLSPSGKIVVIAGTTSVQLQPDYGAACVIRRMWTSYVKALSHQLGPQGISINALSPGVVLTNFHQERIQKKSDETSLTYEEQMQREVANIPLRRLARPQEVAQTIKFLLSDQSDFVNGVNLVLDGGYTTSF